MVRIMALRLDLLSIKHGKMTNGPAMRKHNRVFRRIKDRTVSYNRMYMYMYLYRPVHRGGSDEPPFFGHLA